MRFYACTQCRHVYQVGGKLEEIRSLIHDATEFLCITNLCQGMMRQVQVPPPGFNAIEVPLPSFFRAINGFGLAKGDPASAKKFIEVITTKRIVKAMVEPVGQPERVIVRQLVCEDGTRLHFDTSAKGACCYFIEEPGPSCVEAFNGQLAEDAETAARAGDPSREETGRAPETGSVASQQRSSPKPTADAATSEQPRADGLPIVSETSDLHEAPTSGTGRGGSDVRM